MEKDEVQKMIDAAIADAGKKTDTAIALHVQDAMKDVTKQMTQLQDVVTKPAAQTGEASQGKPLTSEDVAGIVANALSTFEAKQAEAAKATAADEQTKGVLKAYVTEKMKDVPPAYLAQMPVTTDPAKLAEGEKQIRDRMKSELGAVGLKFPDLGATKPAGAKPPADGGKADAEKSGSQLLTEAYAEDAAGK